MTLGSLLVSPYVLNYDLAWLALPIVWFVGYCLRNGWLRWEREILAAAWVLPLLIAPLATLLHAQLGPFVLLAFFCVVLRRVWWVVVAEGKGAASGLESPKAGIA
ncbi:MAG: hypothetical protein JWR07_1586 [Nevskia sp.]|nr:hypothetical protein [Nevskia sp.]